MVNPLPHMPEDAKNTRTKKKKTLKGRKKKSILPKSAPAGQTLLQSVQARLDQLDFRLEQETDLLQRAYMMKKRKELILKINELSDVFYEAARRKQEAKHEIEMRAVGPKKKKKFVLEGLERPKTAPEAVSGTDQKTLSRTWHEDEFRTRGGCVTLGETDKQLCWAAILKSVDPYIDRHYPPVPNVLEDPDNEDYEACDSLAHLDGHLRGEGDSLVSECERRGAQPWNLRGVPMPFANQAVDGSRVWSVGGEDCPPSSFSLTSSSADNQFFNSTRLLRSDSELSLGSRSMNFLHQTKRSSFAVPMGDRRYFFQFKLESHDSMWQMYVSEAMWQSFSDAAVAHWSKGHQSAMKALCTTGILAQQQLVDILEMRLQTAHSLLQEYRTQLADLFMLEKYQYYTIEKKVQKAGGEARAQQRNEKKALATKRKANVDEEETQLDSGSHSLVEAESHPTSAEKVDAKSEENTENTENTVNTEGGDENLKDTIETLEANKESDGSQLPDLKAAMDSNMKRLCRQLVLHTTGMLPTAFFKAEEEDEAKEEAEEVESHADDDDDDDEYDSYSSNSDEDDEDPDVFNMDTTENEAEAHHVVFVIDQSMAMAADNKLDHFIKDVSDYLDRRLHMKSHFNLCTFSPFSYWKNVSQKNSKANIKEAVQFLRELAQPASLSSCESDAMEAIMRVLDDATVDTVYLATAGDVGGRCSYMMPPEATKWEDKEKILESAFDKKLFSAIFKDEDDDDEEHEAKVADLEPHRGLALFRQMSRKIGHQKKVKITRKLCIHTIGFDAPVRALRVLDWIAARTGGHFLNASSQLLQVKDSYGRGLSTAATNHDVLHAMMGYVSDLFNVGGKPSSSEFLEDSEGEWPFGVDKNRRSSISFTPFTDALQAEREASSDDGSGEDHTIDSHSDTSSPRGDGSASSYSESEESFDPSGPKFKLTASMRAKVDHWLSCDPRLPGAGVNATDVYENYKHMCTGAGAGAGGNRSKESEEWKKHQEQQICDLKEKKMAAIEEAQKLQDAKKAAILSAEPIAKEAPLSEDHLEELPQKVVEELPQKVAEGQLGPAKPNLVRRRNSVAYSPFVFFGQGTALLQMIQEQWLEYARVGMLYSHELGNLSKMRKKQQEQRIPPSKSNMDACIEAERQALAIMQKRKDKFLACIDESSSVLSTRHLTQMIYELEERDSEFEVSYESEKGNTPIVAAIRMGGYAGQRTIHQLLLMGANINIPSGKLKASPFILAVQRQDAHMVKFLLTRCGNSIHNARLFVDEDDEKQLQNHQVRNDWLQLDKVIEGPDSATIEYGMDDDDTILGWGSGWDSTSGVAKQRIETEKVEDRHDATPLIAAIRSGGGVILKLILGLPVELKADKEKALEATTLTVKAGHRRADAVGLRVWKASQATATSQKDKNIKRAQKSARRKLICVSANGTSALLEACKNAQVETAMILIKAGAKVNGTQGHVGGIAPLMAAALSGSRNGMQSAALMELLISKGADVNLGDHKGRPALHYAVSVGNASGIDQLILAGADLNLQDHDGTTALMIASKLGHDQAAGLLIGYGCNVDLKNSKGMVAFDFATQRMYPDKHHKEEAKTEQHKSWKQAAGVKLTKTDSMMPFIHSAKETKLAKEARENVMKQMPKEIVDAHLWLEDCKRWHLDTTAPSTFMNSSGSTSKWQTAVGLITGLQLVTGEAVDREAKEHDIALYAVRVVRALERKRQAPAVSAHPSNSGPATDVMQRSVYAMQGTLDWQRENARRKRWHHEWKKDTKLEQNGRKFQHVAIPMKRFIGDLQEREMDIVKMQSSVQLAKATKLRKAAMQSELQTIKQHRVRMEEKRKFGQLLKLAKAGQDDPYTAMLMKEHQELRKQQARQKQLDALRRAQQQEAQARRSSFMSVYSEDEDADL